MVPTALVMIQTIQTTFYYNKTCLSYCFITYRMFVCSGIQLFLNILSILSVLGHPRRETVCPTCTKKLCLVDWPTLHTCAKFYENRVITFFIIPALKMNGSLWETACSGRINGHKMCYLQDRRVLMGLN